MFFKLLIQAEIQKAEESAMHEEDKAWARPIRLRGLVSEGKLMRPQIYKVVPYFWKRTGVESY